MQKEYLHLQPYYIETESGAIFLINTYKRDHTLTIADLSLHLAESDKVILLGDLNAKHAEILKHTKNTI